VRHSLAHLASLLLHRLITALAYTFHYFSYSLSLTINQQNTPPDMAFCGGLDSLSLVSTGFQ